VFAEGIAIRDSAGILNGSLQALNRALEIWPCAEHGLMLHPPHWFKRGLVVCEARDDVPVDMGELVAEEFVIDFLGFIDLGQGLGDQIHFFHQLNPFRGRQMKQLCRVAFEDDDAPAGEELIVVQVSFGEPKVSDEMVVSRPSALAGLAREVVHGWLALRHSSSVTTPFLINN